MGFFGTKKIECPANVWTTIISSSFAQMPVSFRVTFKSVKGETIDGEFSEKRFWWLFPQTPVLGKLSENIIFNRYWINTFYSVEVCPTTNLTAEID